MVERQPSKLNVAGSNPVSRSSYAGLGGDLAYAAANLQPEAYAGPAEREDFVDIRPLYTRTGNAQILRAQLAAIRQARSRIYIQQPYVSDDEVISELIKARRRGVDVRVILPTRNDSGFMNSANLLAAKAFINNGVAAYIAPLWPIDDLLAQHIAIEFYRHLLCERATLDEALRRAKTDARRLTYPDPLEHAPAPAQAWTGLGWASLVL